VTVVRRIVVLDDPDELLPASGVEPVSSKVVSVVVSSSFVVVDFLVVAVLPAVVWLRDLPCEVATTSEL
jgi:hypothetical protein